jgi:hypothetical protein
LILRNLSLAVYRLISIVAAGLIHTACVNGNTPSSQHPAPGETDLANSADLGQIIASHSELIMGLDDVVGIGEGLCNETPCLRILLARENADSRARINEDLRGIPFTIEVSGDFTALPK